MTFIGIDLGGSKLAGVLVDDAGAVLHEVWRAHQVVLDNNAVSLVCGGIEELFAAAASRALSVDGIGVSIAGWLDVARATVVEAANLALTGVELEAVLRDTFARPVHLVNDGDATLLGEVAVGTVGEAANAVLLTLGTGVGGGVLLQGRLAVGALGIAGELGHLPVTPDGDICVCGGRGCLELAVSGVALGKIARSLFAASTPMDGATPGPATAKELGEAVRAGDKRALEALDRAAAALATAVRIFIPTLNPAVVVLAGSVVEGLGDVLVPAILELLAREPSPMARLYRPPEVVVAAARRHGAALGAAHLARERAGDVIGPNQKETRRA